MPVAMCWWIQNTAKYTQIKAKKLKPGFGPFSYTILPDWAYSTAPWPKRNP